MPFIGSRFYINPAHGRALELARAAEDVSERGSQRDQDSGDHWVTIDGHHVLIQASQKRSDNSTQPKVTQFSGQATYYNLPGKKTAAGKQFDPNEMAAAMTAEKAKLGQTVTVTYTYQDSGGKTIAKSISVIVNDRGPFARGTDGKATFPLQPAPGRVIDLTPAAFEKLVGTIKPGHVAVTVTVPNE